MQSSSTLNIPFFLIWTRDHLEEDDSKEKTEYKTEQSTDQLVREYLIFINC